MYHYTKHIMATAMPQPNDMRQPADWMRPMDDRILEALREDGNLTPLALSREGLVPRVDTTRQYISERGYDLLRFGLIARVDKGLFAITDKGRAYLDEELDASTLGELDEPPIADE